MHRYDVAMLAAVLELMLSTVFVWVGQLNIILSVP